MLSLFRVEWSPKDSGDTPFRVSASLERGHGLLSWDVVFGGTSDLAVNIGLIFWTVKFVAEGVYGWKVRAQSYQRALRWCAQFNSKKKVGVTPLRPSKIDPLNGRWTGISFDSRTGQGLIGVWTTLEGDQDTPGFVWKTRGGPRLTWQWGSWPWQGNGWMWSFDPYSAILGRSYRTKKVVREAKLFAQLPEGEYPVTVTVTRERTIRLGPIGTLLTISPRGEYWAEARFTTGCMVPDSEGNPIPYVGKRQSVSRDDKVEDILPVYVMEILQRRGGWVPGREETRSVRSDSWDLIDNNDDVTADPDTETYDAFDDPPEMGLLDEERSQTVTSTMPEPEVAVQIPQLNEEDIGEEDNDGSSDITGPIEETAEILNTDAGHGVEITKSIPKAFGSPSPKTFEADPRGRSCFLTEPRPCNHICMAFNRRTGGCTLLEALQRGAALPVPLPVQQGPRLQP